MALPAHALGLGELRVLSGLGQPLNATVILVGSGIDDLSHTCIRAKISTSEGSFLAQATIVVSQIAKNKAILMSTGLTLNEPAIKISIDVSCETQLHRDFLVLLDPPEFLPAILKNIQTPGVKENVAVEGVAADPRAAMRRKRTVAPLPNEQKSRLAAGRNNGDRNIVEGRNVKNVPRVSALKREKLPKDVLKLSDDSVIESHGLKISDTLSAPLEQQISENLEELRAAQRNMAAILRGENSDRLMNSKQVAEQRKIQTLLAEMTQLKNQNRIDKASLDEIRKNSYSRDWVIGLISLVILSVVIIFLLFIYLRRLQNRTELSWWDQGQEKKEADRRKSIEELVDNVQASYEPNTNEFEDSLHEISRPAPALGSVEVDDMAARASDVDVNNVFNQSNVNSRTPTLEETNSSTFNFFSSRGSSVKVEEISDITQEAEFWMSVNDPQRAIEILDVQANVEHPDSPVPWLYLLDLYRLVKDKTKYDNLRDRFVIFFNANVPEYEGAPEQQAVLQLEDFPHLMERICRTWNGNEVIPYLESLLVDDRDGKRTGFELPVYRDILLLISVAHELERIAAIEGPVASGWTGFNDGLVSNAPIETASDNSLSPIEFEVIDFPRITPPKK